MTKKLSQIVVKIGSRVMSGEDGGIDGAFLADFVGSLARLHKKGHRLTLVSSGAIRTGAPLLKMDRVEMSVSQQQAAAAVGQGVLISRYTELFAAHGIVAAQVLLTPDVMNARVKYLNARNTLRTLLDCRAVPIVNENDTVACDEIKFGDNDTLSATTSILVDADLLILLSDVDGLYDRSPRRDPGARLVSRVREITREIEASAVGPEADGGFGGMTTKLEAARMAMDSGVTMVIAHGREGKIVERIVGGENIGTTFLPRESAMNSRKKWLAFGCKPEGRVIVNEGARSAISGGGGSLLPSGIVSASGDFEHGACVEICAEDGTGFARGLTNYSSIEIDRIKGRQSSEIESILSFRISDEVVHRDNVALI